MARPAPSRPPIATHKRVLIVDDSAVTRAVLGRLIDASDEWVVSRAVGTVEAALAFLADNAIEIILLDVQLPGVDGLTGLPDLIAAAPGARIVVVSSVPAAGVQAMALGAAAVLAKPEPSGQAGRFGDALLEVLGQLGDGRDPVRPSMATRPTARSLPDGGRIVPAPRGAFDLVAIGASTGGIHALSGLIRQLPVSFRLPILVTQHLPATFMPYFAAQVALLAGRPCEVATDRLRVRPGRIVVAPGDAHIQCVSVGEGNVAIRLSRAPSASGCTPSVDPMLASLAPLLGPRLLAVMLSGMGRDGLDGARAVNAAGGCVVAQDSATSVVWGMPGAVVAAEIADAVLPPGAIGDLMASGRRPQ